MRRVETAPRILRCVCRTGMLRADALSTARATRANSSAQCLRRLGPHRCLRSWTSRSPSIPRRCLPTHRLRRCSAQEATPRNARLLHWTFCSLELDAHHHPGWLPALCAVSGGLTPSHWRLWAASRQYCAAGAAPALGPRLNTPGAPSAAATGWGRCAFAPAQTPAWADRRGHELHSVSSSALGAVLVAMKSLCLVNKLKAVRFLWRTKRVVVPRLMGRQFTTSRTLGLGPTVPTTRTNTTRPKRVPGCAATRHALPHILWLRVVGA